MFLNQRFVRWKQLLIEFLQIQLTKKNQYYENVCWLALLNFQNLFGSGSIKIEGCSFMFIQFLIGVENV